jgi:hypothetical protein
MQHWRTWVISCFAIALPLAACHGFVSGGGNLPGSPDASVGGDDDDDGPQGDDDDSPIRIDAGETGDDDDDDQPPAPDAAPIDEGNLQWKEANLTNFESYPDPNSEECQEFNGCTWEGKFAFVEGKQTENWVMMHHIVAVHSRDADEYGLKTLRLRMDGDEIDVTVYDMCSDSDCDGCCTHNAAQTGFLIDIEKYTMEQFGHGDGIVEWACLDCN